MNIETRLSAMQKLADTLSDSVSQMEEGTALLGEWKELADEHDPEDIKEKLDALKEWDRVEFAYGYSAYDVETKLEELERWDSIENEYGDAGEVEDKLEELREWESVYAKYGNAEDVASKLEDRDRWVELGDEHGTPDQVKSQLKDLNDWIAFEDEHGSLDNIRLALKERGTAIEGVEELEVLLTEANDSAKRAWAKLDALKNRSRWQVFLSLFTGRS